MKRVSFKTRARVVDLLGREQIADAPTALTELLKNAVDAQAEKVTINFHSKAGLLEVSDDGLGMRPEDLMDRWLVLATDSRHGKPDPEWYKYANEVQKKRLQKDRPFGEKGIGRLAVASLGNGVLVWTRWGKGKDLKRSMALVHWHLFRYPKLNLEDVYIPFIELGAQDDPKDAAKLLLESLKDWYERHSKDFYIDKKSSIDPKTISNDIKRGFAQAIDSIVDYHADFPGTSFFILSTTDEVPDIFQAGAERKGESNWPSEGLRAIFGFCNPFSDGAPRIKIEACADNRPAFEGKNDFWKSKDFEECDYFIHLRSNAEGFVEGEIRHYSKTIKYEFQTPQLPPQSDYPGPFEIKLGYVLGKPEESRLTPDRFAYFSKKLEEIGALYVYRNGIRVMPYGRQDTDFLEFEYRRSLNAGTYVFSHRRMFGYIGIDSENNPGLIDKAGREGLIKNKYYRGLYKIATSIFIDIAKTHFATKAKKEQKLKLDTALRAEIEEQTRSFLEEFKKSRKILSDAEKLLEKKYADLYSRSKEIERGTIDTIDRFSQDFEALRDRFRLDLDTTAMEIPTLASPSPKVLAAWDSYQTDRQQFEIRWNRDLLQLQRKLSAALKRNADKIKYLNRLRTRLSNNEVRIQARLEQKRDRLIDGARQIAEKKAPIWFNNHVEKIKRIPRDLLGEDPPQAVVNRSDQAAVDFEDAILKQDIVAKGELEPYWDGILRDIERIATARSMDGAVGALTRELEALKERESVYIDLAQIGLIVEGIDHEYRTLFSQAVKDFKILRSGQKTGDNETLEHLQSVFNAINEKIESLAPLYRTGRRRYETVTGDTIITFIRSRFKQEYETGLIQIDKPISSLKWSSTNRSVLFAAIINIINNALYWIEKSANQKEIRVSLAPEGFVISDSGPGVAPLDAERIFEPFFSRKPSGRGLGLYLSKSAMQQHGMDLKLADSPINQALQGANFIFKKPEQEE